jgi:anthranilate synthase component 1
LNALVREVALPPFALRQLAYAMPARYPVLFDSASGGALGRYSILAAFPQAALWLDGAGALHFEAQEPAAASGAATAGAGGFLEGLERWWQALHGEATAAAASSAAERAAAQLPFCGGWAVFLGYEIAAEVEPGLSLPPPPQGSDAPRAFALRVPAALLQDHVSGVGYAVAEAGHAALLPALIADARAAGEPRSSAPMFRVLRILEEEPERFRARVEAALAYIRAGDIYQANLSRPWQVELNGEVEPHQVYERLRTTNPAPFAAWARFAGLTLMSSSPERLVRARDGRVDTRPIAGTRPRSRAPGGDRSETAALIANAKERAEHVMLLDLERNDLGRVCRGGSVHVDEFMITESYAHVHHIVSNVCGELRPGVTPVQVLRAVFPGGTITGCPKYRCMQIIAELEGEGRGAYTGALGYLGRDGGMDFNILIRTLTFGGGALQFRAGAGIVADSHWQRELEETRAKARGLLAAVSEDAV